MWASGSCLERVPEWPGRRLATSQVQPVYPMSASQRNIGGVLVADVRYGKDGRVTSVSVLESPSSVFTVAAANALAQWRFEKVSSLSECERITTITWYFVVINGKGDVLDPTSPGTAQQYQSFKRRSNMKHSKGVYDDHER